MSLTYATDDVLAVLRCAGVREQTINALRPFSLC
jgi:hypothetical protein